MKSHISAAALGIVDSWATEEELGDGADGVKARSKLSSEKRAWGADPVSKLGPRLFQKAREVLVRMRVDDTVLSRALGAVRRKLTQK
jgi:hypothetical protein